jgi:AcrR family transcriptional regulator
MKGSSKNQFLKKVRERLLESALKVFSQKGYAASIREIAEASATTLPSIYYYFGNKEGLYQELMREHLAVFEALMEDFDHISGTAAEKLKSFITKVYLKAIDDMEFIRLLHVMSYGPPKGVPPFDIEPYYRKIHKFITGIISSGIENRDFRPGNPDHMSRIVQGGLQQVVSEGLCFGLDKNASRETLQDILNIILEGFQRGKERE